MPSGLFPRPGALPAKPDAPFPGPAESFPRPALPTIRPMDRTTVLHRLPIDFDDIVAITVMLRQAGALVGTKNPSTDWYDFEWYLWGVAVEGVEFSLIIDRNVYTRAAALGGARAGPITDQHRLAAAVVCFAHCCGLQIDASAAILEHELDSGDPQLMIELPKARRMFAAGPRALADLALGRVERLELPTESEQQYVDDTLALTEANRPHPWWPNYGCALKLAVLLCDSTFTNDIDRMLAFVEWCYKEFFFSAGATVYGSLALSPQPARGMFKRLRGQNEAAAMRGIRNAAWDMTLISVWGERQRTVQDTQHHHLICSFDAAVTDTARTVMTQGMSDEDSTSLLYAGFKREWGERNGKRLFDRFQELRSTVDSDLTRPANQKRPLEYWNSKIAELERHVSAQRAILHV